MSCAADNVLLLPLPPLLGILEILGILGILLAPLALVVDIMTRTARSTYPRAIRKDRCVYNPHPTNAGSSNCPHNPSSSESKSGFDKSIKKNGAGAHSWGALLTDPTTQSLDDNEYTSDEAESQDQVSNMSFPTTGNVSHAEGDKKTRTRSASNVSIEDVINAKEFRKRVFSNADTQGG